MAKQTINIGTTANDGTGESFRSAWDKCNDNFDELYNVSIFERVSVSQVQTSQTAVFNDVVFVKNIKFEESIDKPGLFIGTYRDVRLGDTAGQGVYNLVAIGKNMFGNGVAGTDRITDSVVIGTDCCTHFKHGNGTVALGNLALYEIVDSNSNTALGDSALRNTVHTTGDTGWQNTAVGYVCGQGNTTGAWNVFIGSYCRWDGDGTGNYNVFIGGYAAGNDEFTATGPGDYNIGLGYTAMRYATGDNCVGIGFESLINADGSNLTAIGHRSGAAVESASASTSTYIGALAGASEFQKTDAVNSTAIGYNAYNTRDNEVVIGNASVLHTVLRGDVTGIGMISLTQDYGGVAPSNGLWRGSGFTFLTVGASGLQINDTANSIGLFNLLPTGQINMRPPSSATPSFNGQATFEFTSDTTFTIKAKGSDGTVRSVALTLTT